MSLAQLTKVPKLLSALLPFICLAGIVVLQGQEYKRSLRQLNTGDYLLQEQEQARLLDWQKKSPNLGFSNLVADWTYLNFIQYFGDEKARETIGYKIVPNYFETITQIDPHFTKAYLNLSIANSMYAGNPENTIALMEEVLESVNPQSEDAVFLWSSKGLDELLFMGDRQAAINSYEMAAKWADLSNSDRSEDVTIKDLELALQSISDIELKEAQIRAWSSVLVHIKDHHRKREIIDRISNLQADILVLKQSSPNTEKFTD